MSTDKVTNNISDKDCDCKKKSILSSEGFGISNGVSTILALLAGFHATRTPKFSVIGALLSLLLTDPINDSYSIYISMKHNNPVEAYKNFKGTFMAQIGVQGIFLVIVILTRTIYDAFLVSSMVGILLLSYDYNKRLKNKHEMIMEFTKIVALIILTFTVNTLFYKYYNKKL